MLDNGAKVVSLDYDGRGLWLVQTPITQLPYGMNVFDKDGKNPKYSVDVSFRGSEDDPKVKAFQTMAESIDDHMIELGLKNAQAWFKMTNPSREVIKAFYTPMVKIPVDKEGRVKPYPPTCKIALKQKDGVFTTEFYDPQKKRYEGVPIEELLVRGTKMRSIIKCTGIWIAGSKYGLSWKAEQICIDSMPDRLRGFGFSDEEGSSSKPSAKNHFSNLVEDDDEDSAAAAVMPSSTKKVVQAIDSEEEDEDDEVVEATPVPPKKVQPSQPTTTSQPKKAQPKKTTVAK
jgi:hypothetical protein